MNIVRKIALILVILSAVAMAKGETGAELITDSWFYDLDVVHVNGYDFTIDISSDKVFVNYGEGYYWLEKGECESKEITKICYEDKSYDSTRYEDKVNLEFYTIFPVVTISRSVDENSFSIGDTATVSIQLSNTGLKEAEDVIFEDMLPDEIEITSHSSSLEQIGNRIRWTGEIKTQQTVSFSYKIQGKKTGTASYKASVSYYDGFTERETTSSSLRISVGNPQTITLSTNASNIYIGDVVDFDALLLNQNNDRITIHNLQIFIPDNFVVIQDDNDVTKMDERLYSWSGSLSYNQSVNFDLILQAMYEGEYDIIVRGTTEKDKIMAEFEETQRISVSKKDLIIKTLITKEERLDISDSGGIVSQSSDDKEMESFQEGRLLVYIQNPYNNIDLKDIDVRVSSVIAQISSVVIAQLNRSNTRKIIDRTIAAPEVSSSKKYKIKTVADYYTEHGIKYSSELEEDLTINPIKELSIKQSLSTSNIEEGDEITVSVSVKNNRDILLENVKVREIIPTGIKIKGLTSKTTDIPSDDEVDIYEYTLKFPITGNTTPYVISTTVEYEDNIQKYNLEKKTTVNVKKKSPDIDFDQDFDSSSAVIGEIVPLVYTLENEDEQTIKNIHIRFPFVEKTLYVDDFEYNLSQLDSGDLVIIDDVAELIFFKNESNINIPKSIVEFEDTFGNSYSKESNKESIDVEDSAYQEAFLTVSREFSSTSTDKDTLEHEIIVENLGKKSTSFTLYEDRNILIEDSISPGEAKTYPATAYRENYGKIALDPLIAKFSVAPKTYYALSDEYQITFTTSQAEVVEEDDDEPITPVEADDEEKEEKDIKEETTEIIEKTEKVNFLQKIINFISSLFGRNK